MKKLNIWKDSLKNNDKDLEKKVEDTDFDKHDTAALIFAAIITIMPVVVMILLAFVAIVWLIFLR